MCACFTQSCRFILQSQPDLVQLHPVEQIVGKLDALLVLIDYEAEVLRFLCLLVLWNSDPLQRPGVLEQFVQHLLRQQARSHEGHSPPR